LSKHNRRNVLNYNPAKLDREPFRELCRRCGAPQIQDLLHSLKAGGRLTGPDEDLSMLDEFAVRGIECPEDLRAAFTHNFYFGCEADDPKINGPSIRASIRSARDLMQSSVQTSAIGTSPT
jgi:hypothetical protein